MLIWTTLQVDGHDGPPATADTFWLDAPMLPEGEPGALFAPIRMQLRKPSQCPLITSVLGASKRMAAVGVLLHAGTFPEDSLLLLIVQPFSPRI